MPRARSRRSSSAWLVSALQPRPHARAPRGSRSRPSARQAAASRRARPAAAARRRGCSARASGPLVLRRDDPAPRVPEVLDQPDVPEDQSRLRGEVAHPGVPSPGPSARSPASRPERTEEVALMADLDAASLEAGARAAERDAAERGRVRPTGRGRSSARPQPDPRDRADGFAEDPAIRGRTSSVAYVSPIARRTRTAPRTAWRGRRTRYGPRMRRSPRGGRLLRSTRRPPTATDSRNDAPSTPPEAIEPHQPNPPDVDRPSRRRRAGRRPAPVLLITTSMS